MAVGRLVEEAEEQNQEEEEVARFLMEEVEGGFHHIALRERPVQEERQGAVEHQMSQVQEEHPWLAEEGNQSHVLAQRSHHIRRILGQQQEVEELTAKEHHRLGVVVVGRRSRCRDDHHSSRRRRGDLCHLSVHHDPEPMAPHRR